MNFDRLDDVGRRASAQAAIIGPRRLSREALRRSIESPALSIVADGASLSELMAEAAPGTKLDLILYILGCDAEVEEHFPRIEEARFRSEGVKTIILAEGEEARVKLKAVSLGVEAFLSKDISVDVLPRVIELVLLGQQLFPAGLARLLLDHSPCTAEAPLERPADPLPGPTQPDAAAALSIREQQVVLCLVNGLTNKAIARELDIAEATVKVHVKALLRKTRMANRTQAAIWALNNSLGTGPHRAQGPAGAAPPPIGGGRTGQMPSGSADEDEPATNTDGRAGAPPIKVNPIGGSGDLALDWKRFDYGRPVLELP